LLVGLLVLEEQVAVSVVGHQVAALVIGLLMYSLVLYWLWNTRPG
jgi:hypothetical protein